MTLQTRLGNYRTQNLPHPPPKSRYIYLSIPIPPNSLPIPTPGISLPTTTTLPIAPINLLLQHNAIHARLEERKDETRLALEFAQAVEDFGCRRAG